MPETASMMPSSAQATGRSPRPIRSMAWWWRLLTPTEVVPITAASASAGLDRDLVDGVGRTAALAVHDVGDLGQVLLERAAQRHVEHLVAAADAEQRQAEVAGGAGQRQLEHVGVGMAAGDVGRGLGAVVLRVDVAAAGQQQAVESGHHLVDVVGIDARHDERQPAGAQHGVDIAPVERLDRLLVVHRRRRGDPDPRLGHGVTIRGARYEIVSSVGRF